MNRREYLNGGSYLSALRGNDLPQAKLNEEIVGEIRKNIKGLTMKQMAEKYGVHKNTIQSVIYRRTWGTYN